MIFDWLENGKKVLESSKFTVNDTWDKRSLELQERYFLQYIYEELGGSKQECYKIWKSIKGGIAEAFSYDEDHCYIEFKRLYAKMLTMHHNNRLRDLNYQFAISNGEIEYLNSLDAPQWVRQYWLGILIWFKYSMIHTGRSYSHPQIEGWIFKQIDPNHKFKHKKEEIRKWNRHCGMVINRKVVGNHSYVTIKWADGIITVDDPAVIIQFPSDITKCLDLIKPEGRICPVCGKQYIFSSKTQRNMCEDCYKVYRRAQKAEYIRNRRQKHQM